MVNASEIKVGMLLRHKGGKLYKVCNDYTSPSEPRWGFNPDRTGSIAELNRRCDTTRVDCVQWQVNEKYPEGREYQASRTLKLVDLTIATDVFDITRFRK